MFAIDAGFDIADEYALGLLGFGIALFAAIGALSHQEERAFSASIIYLGLGLLAAAALSLLGISAIDPLRDALVIEHVTELALIVAVFSTGLAVERRLSWEGWRSVAGLLGIVMPLSIATVAFFGVLVMDLSLGAAIILGAVLAPTDPVLAGDVGVSAPGDTLEDEPRFNLGTEAALNDGLATPFVLLGIFVAEEGGTGWLSEWLAGDLIYGMLVGGALGAIAGRLIGGFAVRLRNARLLDERLDFYFAVPTVLVVYGAAQFIGAFGLLAAFCAGFAFRRYEFEHEYNRHVHDGAEVVEKFAELVVILLLGSMVTIAGLEAPGLSGWLLVPVLLFVIRPALVMALFARSRMSVRERLFVSWFGVRGVAAIYYAMVVVGAGALGAGEEEIVLWTAIVCVMVSILLHGMSAAPLIRRLLS
ncbi:MAG TPA: cation:proton antiporter [Thermoleophilaceae bacterium]|nr:cation:proton antiporter [Thermoleophilaceae bacterium]